MPEKTTKSATPKRYAIDGKKFVWHPFDEDDQMGNLPDVEIPMRIKLKLIRSMAGTNIDDVSVMFDILEKLIPNQGDTLDEMDVNDFQTMFSTWMTEYNALTGASLGE